MQQLAKIDRLERDLRKALTFGGWEIGEKLPAEDELMRKFGASRPLLREAMKALVVEGLVVRRHGSGTYLHHIPRKRIDVYVCLNNILSPFGSWYRDMIDSIKEMSRSVGWDIEVVTAHGANQHEIASSLSRQLCRPSGPEQVGAIILFYNPELERRLQERGDRWVSVTAACGAEMLCKSVIIDYVALGRQIRDWLDRQNIKNVAVCFNETTESWVGPVLYRELNETYRHIAGSDGILFDADTPHELAEKFADAVASGELKADALAFLDDGACEMCAIELHRRNLRLPENVTVLTQAHKGQVFSFRKTPVRFGFDTSQMARAAWEALLDPDLKCSIRLAPELLPA